MAHGLDHGGILHNKGLLKTLQGGVNEGGPY